MNCQWIVLPDFVRCTRCGRQIARSAGELPRAECNQSRKWNPIDVGEVVEKALASVGVTSAAIERATGAKDCGCKRRKAALTKAGNALQAAAVNAFRRVFPRPGTHE